MSQPTTHSTQSTTVAPQRRARAYVPEDFDHELLALLADPPSTEPRWQDRGLCAQTDPEAFFPEKGGSNREAKRICTGCEVAGDCLDWALQNDERFGIWGGTTERERRRMRREQQPEGTR